jgi:hypothetical protein
MNFIIIGLGLLLEITFTITCGPGVIPDTPDTPFNIGEIPTPDDYEPLEDVPDDPTPVTPNTPPGINPPPSAPTMPPLTVGAPTVGLGSSMQLMCQMSQAEIDFWKPLWDAGIPVQCPMVMVGSPGTF